MLRLEFQLGLRVLVLGLSQYPPVRQNFEYDVKLINVGRDLSVEELHRTLVSSWGAVRQPDGLYCLILSHAHCFARCRALFAHLTG